MGAIPKKAYLILALVTITFVGGSYLFFKEQGNGYIMTDEDSKKVEDIRQYINSISDSFLKDVETLAKDKNLVSWGCGPSSYAIARILDRKFFNDQLPIDSLYDKEPIEIVERFGFVQNKVGVENSVIDHAWIEVFFKNKLIYIDPTVARYGRVDGIAFEVFDIGQEGIKSILKDKYGVVDNRISVLLTKIYSNIPVDESPYQGMTIDEEPLPHYDKILKVRNTVSLGREPITWKQWADYLTSKYN